MLQRFCRPQTAETATDDHHMRRAHMRIIRELRLAVGGLWIGLESRSWPSSRISALIFRWRRPARSIALTRAAFRSAYARAVSSQWTVVTPMTRREAKIGRASCRERV